MGNKNIVLSGSYVIYEIVHYDKLKMHKLKMQNLKQSLKTKKKRCTTNKPKKEITWNNFKNMLLIQK